MKNTTPDTLYAALLLGLGALVISTYPLDISLVPRFLYISALLLMGLPLLYRRVQAQPETTILGVFDIVLLAFAGWHTLAAFWGVTPSLAIFSAQKVGLLTFTYFALRTLLLSGNISLVPTISRINLGVAIAILIAMVYQATILTAQYKVGLIATDFYYLQGFSSHKNLAAAFLLLLQPFLCIGYINEPKGNWRWLYGSVIVLSLVTLLLLQVRAEYIGLAAMGVFVGGSAAILLRYIDPKKLLIPLGAIALLLAVAIVGNWVAPDSIGKATQRLNVLQYSSSRSAQERIFLWGKTRELIADAPVIGIGTGSWETLHMSKGVAGWDRTETGSVFFQRPHNDFLWVWSEQGSIGIILFSLLFILPFIAGFVTLRHAEPSQSKSQQLSLILVLAALVGYIVDSNLSFPKERIEHQLWLALIWAAHYYYCQSFYRKLWKVAIPPRILPYLFGATAIILLFNLYTGYYRLQGEHYTEKASKAKSQKNWQATKKNAIAAYSPQFYTLDYASMPIKWVEAAAEHQTNNLEAALKCYQDAYHDHPYNYKVINDLASTYGQLKDYKNAEKYLLLSAQVNEGDDATNQNLTYVYYLLGDYEKAKYYLEKVRDESRKAKFAQDIANAEKQTAAQPDTAQVRQAP